MAPSQRGAWRSQACASAVPVICVGNFVAGGAGKTPAAVAIAGLLLELGERPAFLSRGYGGAGGDKAIAVDPNIHRADEVGDEPLLLARAAPCFVARDRRLAARAAISAGRERAGARRRPAKSGARQGFQLRPGRWRGRGWQWSLPAGRPVCARTARRNCRMSRPSSSSTASPTPASPPMKRSKPSRSSTPGSSQTRPSLRTLRNQNVLAFAGIGRPAEVFRHARGARRSCRGRASVRRPSVLFGNGPRRLVRRGRQPRA